MFGGSGPRSAAAGPQQLLWILDLKNFKWEPMLMQKGSMPLPRDDHTAVIYEGREMVVFGGFVDGSERTNDVYIYNIKDNKWEKVDTGRVAPKPRAGHSAVIYHHSMVIFGGRDEDNEKLNDVWVFDL